MIAGLLAEHISLKHKVIDNTCSTTKSVPLLYFVSKCKSCYLHLSFLIKWLDRFVFVYVVLLCIFVFIRH